MSIRLRRRRGPSISTPAACVSKYRRTWPREELLPVSTGCRAAAMAAELRFFFDRGGGELDECLLPWLVGEGVRNPEPWPCSVGRGTLANFGRSASAYSELNEVAG